jgi:phage shock protein E
MSIKTLLIDVRSPDEFSGGHREGAINIPIEMIMAGDIGELASVSKDNHIECYCLSGARASYAVGMLNQFGFKDVVNGGGFYGV